MKLSDIALGRAVMIEVRPRFDEHFDRKLEPLQDVRLLSVGMDSGMMMTVGTSSCEIEGVDKQNEQRLTDLAFAGGVKYAWIVNASPKAEDTLPCSVLMEVRVFPKEYRWPDQIDIGVDDKVVEMAQKKRKEAGNITNVIDWLTDEILVVDAKGDIRVLLSGSPDLQANLRSGFRLHGKSVAVDIVRKDDDRLTVNKIVGSRQNQSVDDQRPVMPVCGMFRFVDQTVAGQFKGQARSELDQIVNDAGSYLGIWKEYNKLEQRIVYNRAREFGWFNYKKVSQLPEGGWRFYLTGDENFEKKRHHLQSDESLALAAATVPPPELTSPKYSMDDEPDEKKKKRIFSGECKAFNHVKRTLDLRLPDENSSDLITPPEKGVLYFSLGGDRVRLERRNQAMKKILSATCPMPQLGLIFEGRSVPQRRRSFPDPLSPAARQAFGGEPTPQQRKALKVALETPDIALIQGPPGTGKTRVIAALQARLAELGEDTESVSGSSLLTSYQHDAVENAVNATRVFGLPALKIGKKRFKSEENSGFEQWRMERMEAVRATLAQSPDLPIGTALKKCVDHTVAYLNAPSQTDESLKLVRIVRDLAGPFIPPDLADELLVMEQALKRPEIDISNGNIDTEQALKSVRGLRTTTAAFSDDGPRQARKAQKRLEALNILDPDETCLLECAAEWDLSLQFNRLNELQDFQNTLIDRLLSQTTPAAQNAVHADVEDLVKRVILALKEKVRTSRGGSDAVLYDYYDDLENDPYSLKDTIRQYTAVLAATCQQAVGYHMTQRKGDDLFFQTVVVDEAARANPLDLFIPMALAKRRIILVGDHRQLPHIMDQEIENDLNSDASEKTREMLKTSLFERLFNQLKERELTDGIQRTVTLDRQYRMHPVLGDFVSDSFYHGYGETFESGGNKVLFSHSLSRYDKAVAAWKDIPRKAGGEKKGLSKSRKVEASWLAKEAKQILEECPEYSVGVISFYSEQVNEILREMEPLGLSEGLEGGGYRIHKDWETGRSEKGNLQERLRVGTVDAFQGKEFDIVLLSMTRSNDFSGEEPQNLRKKYGHLILENRLCVAMSRQKRLLIVAGDTGMLMGEAAKKAVPALVAFHELCGGEHGIRI